MKKILPILFLLFICTISLNLNAVSQEPIEAKMKMDTAEEVIIVCSFPELEALFAGGDVAWQRFVTRHLVYPKKAIRKKIQGIVTVQFLVGKDGTVSDVEALSGPEELRQSAVDVVTKSQKWDPALQRGRNVSECKKVDIVFKLQS